MNKQKPEGPFFDNRGRLMVHSLFYTLQGEGPSAGKPAIFIRLAGCNLKCPKCDTIYTGEGVERWEPGDLTRYCLDASADLERKPLIVLTGGEPFRQNIGPLLIDLKDVGFLIEIETNGVLPLIPEAVSPFVKIICSPKTEFVHPDIQKEAYAWKFIVDAQLANNTRDGIPLYVLGNQKPIWTEVPAKSRSRIYLQPQDYGITPLERAKSRKALRRATELCLKHGYNLSLQINKIANLP